MGWRQRTKRLAPSVFRRDGYRCVYCRRTVDDELSQSHPRRATIDHRIPVIAGGGSKINNLYTACFQCNSAKGDMPHDVFIWYRRMRLGGNDHDQCADAIRDVVGDLVALERCRTLVA